MMPGNESGATCACGAEAQAGRSKCSRCRYLASPEAVGRRRYAPRQADAAEDLGPELPPPPVLPLRPCIGCGLRPVNGAVYCSTCRQRLSNGTPIDLESFPTKEDAERLDELERRQGRRQGRFGLRPLAERLRGPHRRGRR